MEDIKQNPEVVDTINAIINSPGGIAEVKIEKNGITVVEILRKVRSKGRK